MGGVRALRQGDEPKTHEVWYAKKNRGRGQGRRLHCRGLAGAPFYPLYNPMNEANRPSILMATDIFGATPALLHLAQELNAKATLISPYGTKQPLFASESAAYAAFAARSSIPAYAAAVRHALGQAPQPFDLALGFSVGATALWLCLDQSAHWLPRQAVLYYGSRIREHLSLAPCCRTQLLFAEHETSFSPKVLATKLRSQSVDAGVLLGSAHGFMNPQSPGYNHQLYAQELCKLKALLT